MHRLFVPVSVALGLTTAPAMAGALAQAGVTPYGPEFFAAARPANALEMVQRLPGFTLDVGDTVRGFEGAAGNVLIDGRRPASKSDALDALLQRMPASRVERIEVIRGGAPGIDMQGKSVLANVILKPGGGLRGLVAIGDNYVVDDGRHNYAMRLEASGGAGGRNWELGLRSSQTVDDGVGPGPHVSADSLRRVLTASQIRSKADGPEHIATAAYELPLLGGRLKINGRLYGFFYNYRETDSFALPQGQLTSTHDTIDEVNSEVGARWNRGLGRRASVELLALRQGKSKDFGETFIAAPGQLSNFEQDQDSTESIARGVVKITPPGPLSFEAGGEGAFNQLDSSTAFSHAGVDVAVPAANVRVKEKRGEVFAKVVWRPARGWTVEGAVRREGSNITSSGDLDLEKTLYFTKPRLAIAWDAAPSTQLRVRLERTVGQLKFDDFVATAALNKGQVATPTSIPSRLWWARRRWSSASGVGARRC